jgi:hypothetical protein
VNKGVRYGFGHAIGQGRVEVVAIGRSKTIIGGRRIDNKEWRFTDRLLLLTSSFRRPTLKKMPE